MLLPTDIIKAMVVPTEWRAPNAPETKGFAAPPSEATRNPRAAKRGMIGNLRIDQHFATRGFRI
ncbi:hypothetical protein [Azospirillum sp.]|uniref:hypothetical protein n=1 Tax=Azospirillum sp. TaxID=34012 RepID=UPI0026259238|nr:hypothetical protein [Azospirillum sp.]